MSFVPCAMIRILTFFQSVPNSYLSTLLQFLPPLIGPRQFTLELFEPIGRPGNLCAVLLIKGWSGHIRVELLLFSLNCFDAPGQLGQLALLRLEGALFFVGGFLGNGSRGPRILL